MFGHATEQGEPILQGKGERVLGQRGVFEETDGDSHWTQNCSEERARQRCPGFQGRWVHFMHYLMWYIIEFYVLECYQNFETSSVFNCE